MSDGPGGPPLVLLGPGLPLVCELGGLTLVLLGPGPLVCELGGLAVSDGPGGPVLPLLGPGPGPFVCEPGGTAVSDGPGGGWVFVINGGTPFESVGFPRQVTLAIVEVYVCVMVVTVWTQPGLVM